MTLSAGTRLGPYEIVSPLGAGGMGEVYRARDTRLGREVALKMLPAAFAEDAERLARFEREARMLASLNHPHIAAIYGLEESGETRLLVLELVHGETLAERIAAGPLPGPEALGIARQIAEALEAAHEKGIVHRDLKPSNVKITPAGKAKVLDFGLAKAFGPEPGPERDVSLSPTVTSGRTEKGVILGTAAYMSPEQARGKPIDRRTDIWAFGCVLYEMLTGRRAFEGETVSDVLASVLTRDVDWSALPAGTPAHVRDLLRRCLQKDPDRRQHDVADARIEIDEALAETSGAMPSAAVAAPSRPRTRLWILAATALASAALAALLIWRAASPGPARGAPVVTQLARLTGDTGSAEWPTWSPDGTLLAYASNRSGNFEIYVRRGEGGQDVNISNDPDQDFQPAFSPDGSSVAFVSTRSSRTGLIKIGGTYGRNIRTYGGDLWIVPALGGSARRLASDANFPVWRPDGQSILYVSGSENRRSILEVPAAGGTPRPVLSSEASSWEISRLGASPDGRWISIEIQPVGILQMPAAGGRPQRLVAGFGHAWDASSNRLYFCARDSQGGSRIQFVEVSSTGKPSGKAPVTVSLMIVDFLELAISRDGSRIVAGELTASRNLTRLPLSSDGGAPSGPEEPLTSGRVTDSYPSVSPDGRRVAVVSDTLGHMETRILDLDSRRSQRLPLPGEDAAQVGPVWMPDGRNILVSRAQVARNTDWIVAVDGSRAEKLLDRSAMGSWTINPSPDSRKLLYVDVTNGVQQVFDYDLASHKATQLTDSPGDKFDSVYSPDSKWIAVTGTKDGGTQLFRMPASGGPLQQLTTGYERMRHVFFSHDSRWIYVQPSHRNIFRVRAEGGPLQQITHFPDAGLFLEEPTISPDGRYLYYCRGNGGSALWLLTLENPGGRR